MPTAPANRHTHRPAAWCLSGLVALLATGCASLSQIPDVDLAKAPEKIDYPQARATAPEPLSGSLYNATSFRPGFEDHRARLVGDVLTIHIEEGLIAKQEAKSNVKRDTKASANVSSFPFLSSNLVGKLGAGMESNNSMTDAGGNTTANNEFEGKITTVVTDVLPNGHLLVVGEKQIGVNQNVDVLQFSGTVDPRTIRPGNTVQSTQVANVRVLSRGRGAQADAQTFGWLSRFFLTLLPF